MDVHAVIIGGFETAYMQKLALYLGGRFGERARVGIAQSIPAEMETGTVWMGSEAFLAEVRQRQRDALCIPLTEEASDDETAVYRYQSCERLYQQVALRYRHLCGDPVEVAGVGRQHWTVVTTDGAATELLAFSLTCARLLAERGRVLYLNLSECSGMAELLFLERGKDLTDLVAALRKDRPVCLDAFTRQMESFDYLMPPANPMVLHELRERDIARLIQLVDGQEEYEHVILALGTTCCGCEHFFRRAQRLLHLTRQDTLRACGRHAWREVIAMCRGTEELPLSEVSMPPTEETDAGIHLLQEWQEGTLGRVARQALDGEEKN